ncbi:MAG: Flp family type IVb pilin [Syntrophales bacterium]|jgi:pilus assembly protein Flp/PilA|nr:Flp family type IVb pilin [Syntrophales bacterium]MDY0044759.1 Flp family type IVb pilin [Syntrophales bacterium]
MLQFLRSEDGAVAIEYGLIAAGIAVAIASIVWLIGDKIEAVFTSVNTALTP